MASGAMARGSLRLNQQILRLSAGKTPPRLEWYSIDCLKLWHHLYNIWMIFCFIFHSFNCDEKSDNAEMTLTPSLHLHTEMGICITVSMLSVVKSYCHISYL